MRITSPRIWVFILIIAAPLATLLIGGSVAPYGKRQHPDFPKLSRILRGKPGALDKLGDALLKRSRATVLAIATKNWLSADVYGFVDTKEVVSGLDGWLFYKAQFKCWNEADYSRAIARANLLRELASAAGIEFIMAVAPDKAVIYPEYLHPHARRYTACKAATAAALRRAIARDAPWIIDHGQALLADKNSTGGAHKLFFHTDTHWTPLGASLGLRQLLNAMFPQSAVPASPKLTGKLLSRETDLPWMLLLRQSEQYDEVAGITKHELSGIDSASLSQETFILHDSFYLPLLTEFTGIFPNSVAHRIVDNNVPLPDLVGTAKRVIVSTVERGFIERIEIGNLSPEGSLTKAILARNMQRAEQCDFTAAAPAPVHRSGDVEATAAMPGDGVSLTVPLIGPNTLPCLRIASPGQGEFRIELLFPQPMSDAGPDPRRVVELRLTNTAGPVSIVLPAYMAGKKILLRAKGDGGEAGPVPAAVFGFLAPAA
jgi:hypothetical protein